MTPADYQRYCRIAPRLRQLSLNDPHVHMLVRQYLNGDIPDYQGLLEQVCFSLATQKQGIMDAALRERQLSTRSLIVKLGDDELST